MSRGFESFELDDFRDSQSPSEPSDRRKESSRGRGSSSQPEASVRIKLAKLRETEYQADISIGRAASAKKQSPCPAIPVKLTFSRIVNARKFLIAIEAIRSGHRRFAPLQKSASFE